MGACGRVALGVVGAVTVAVGAGCGAVASHEGLTGDSTCKEWLEAEPAEQNQVILDLVSEAEGGARNGMREGNALMQFSFVCEETRAGSSPTSPSSGI